MTEFTKERLEQFIHNPLEHGLTRGEQMEMARQLLASMEQEPVAWLWTKPSTGDEDVSLIAPEDDDDATDAVSCGWVHQPLYTAPPAPVVPDIGEISVGRLPTMNQDDYPGLGDWWVQLRIGEDCDEVLARVYGATPQEANSRAEALACRAAMLQGAAGNSPAIPDGWVACSERMPEESGRYLCCVEDKDGLEKYQWICTWDGENPSSPLWNHYGDWVTHWMELPEDPQQDVNPIGGSATYDFSTDEVVTNPPPERGYVVTCDGADHFYRNNQEAQKHVMDAINRRSAPVSLVTLDQVPTRLFSEVRSFGNLSVHCSGSGLSVCCERFIFIGGTAPTDKVVDKYLLQGVINYLQEYCDTLSEDDSRVMWFYDPQQEGK